MVEPTGSKTRNYVVFLTISSPSIPLRPGGHRQEPRQDPTLEESVKDGTPQGLVKRANVEQEGEDGEGRKRDRQLPPRLQRLPPLHQSRRPRPRFHRAAPIVAGSGAARRGRLRP